MEPIVADFFRHNLWANLRMLDACASLPDEVLEASVDGTYGTVRDALPGIDHAVEHRTHIETILTQRGIQPPETDGISYFQSGGR